MCSSTRCETGVVELRALPATRRTFTPVGVWQPLGAFITEEVRANQNVYVGVAVRRDASSGTAAKLSSLSAVWVDSIVHRPTCGPADDVPVPVLDARRVRARPARHWKLREPFDLTKQCRARAGGLAAAPARRLPPRGSQRDRPGPRPPRAGTFNYKYGEPRKVTLVEETDAVVDVSELDDAAAARSDRQQRARTRVRHRARRAERRVVFAPPVAAAGACPAAAIIHTVETLNAEQCDPPLRQDELRKLLHQALTQRDRPDFTPPIGIAARRRRRPATVERRLHRTARWCPSRCLGMARHGCPVGKGVVLAGDPGMGKSMLALDLAARVSAGDALADR